MQIDSCHFEIHVHSMDVAHDYYIGKLGFELMQSIPAIGLVSVRTGNIRISIFADSTIDAITTAANTGGAQIIYRTADLASTIEQLKTVGIDIPEISDAAGFMKFISLRDPSGNRVNIAQYLRDPLVAI